MAKEKKPSIYSDRGTIGSSEELDEYGVWVKSEPQDLSSGEVETPVLDAELSGDEDMDFAIPEIEDLPDFDSFDEKSTDDFSITGTPTEKFEIPDIESDNETVTESNSSISVESGSDDFGSGDLTEEAVFDSLDTPSLEESPDSVVLETPSETTGLDESGLEDDFDFPEIDVQDQENLSPDVGLSLTESSDDLTGISTDDLMNDLIDKSMDDLIENFESEDEALSDVPIESDSSAVDEEQVSSSAQIQTEIQPGTSTPKDSGVVATSSSPDLSTQLLMKIAEELSSIRAELSSLKKEFSVIRSAAPSTETEEGGFFDKEDDEKISLTGDELNNILNTADFTEETGTDITMGLSDDDIGDSDLLAVPDVEIDAGNKDLEIAKEPPEDQAIPETQDLVNLSSDQSTADISLSEGLSKDIEVPENIDLSADTELSGDTEPSVDIALSGGTEPSGDTEPSVDIDLSGVAEPSVDTVLSGVTEPSVDTELSGDTEFPEDIVLSGDIELSEDIGLSEGIEPSADTALSGTIDLSGVTAPSETIDLSGVTEPSVDIDLSGVTEPSVDIDLSGVTEPFETIDLSGDTALSEGIDLTGEDTSGFSLEASESKEGETITNDLTMNDIDLANDTSVEAEEPIDMDFEEAVIDEPDLSLGIQDNSIEEPLPDDLSVNLDIEEPSLEIPDSEESGNTDIAAEEPGNLEIVTEEPSSEETVTEEPPSPELSSDELSILELGVEDFDIAESAFEEPGSGPTEEEPVLEEDFGVLAADEKPEEDFGVLVVDDEPGEKTEEAEAPHVEEKEQKVVSTDDKDVSGIPKHLKQELKTVLSYMDQLLEALPDEKIEEFARSEYYDTYKKLFKELGIT